MSSFVLFLLLSVARDAWSQEESFSSAATPAEKIKLPEGFKAELLYSVPFETQGSWISLTVDPRGRLITSDQYGQLYRVTVPAIGDENALTKVEPLNVGIGTAHGLLYAFDSLYVVSGERDQGLYRLRDTDNDDQFDDIQLLRQLPGRGEHGPHSIIMGPDGMSIYLCAGNHTNLPPMEKSLVPRNWQEDQLLPRMWDAGGHAVGRLAPGGWICRLDPEGREFELISVGYRNMFDIAFNADGELFTYDSDMEWDIGSPWYRPTRVVHATAGSEFGWRSGTGKWPDFYPDSLPAAVNIGPGSPTGIVFGSGARFPEKYQRALFISDWSYGKLYVVDLEPTGSSYTGNFELFATASPLALTDVIIHPQDGAMYFATGGRRTQSGLYRITYVGDEPTEPVDLTDTDGRDARQKRREIEALFRSDSSAVVGQIWPNLDHKDRFIRYAARIALEHQPIKAWQKRALQETRPEAVLNLAVALARCGDAQLAPQIISFLDKLKWNELTSLQQLSLLRCYGLVFIRTGRPNDSLRTKVLAKVDAAYPAQSQALNQELCRLLVYLNAPTVVSRTLHLMTVAPTQEEQIHYAYCLRPLSDGWTMDQRREYFEWFVRAAGYRGGHSFQGFLVNIRQEAIETLDEKEKEALAELIKIPLSPTTPPELNEQRPFVQKWTMKDFAQEVAVGLKDRDFENGKRMFAAATCFKCHRFDGQGGIIGPDLTGVGKRFDYRYLLESIIEPNKTISDQYQATVFVLESGQTVTGKVANLNNDQMMVITNMLEPGSFTNVRRAEVEEQFPSPVSMMPEGLVDTLTRDEVLDLLAYLRSEGNSDFEAFKR